MARLYRLIPLLVLLALVAGIVYLIMTFRYSSNRAKEVLIDLFTWINGILSIIFGLATLYALFEQNNLVIELAASFLAVSVIALLVTRLCRRIFIKHHPNYAFRASHKAKPQEKTFFDVLRDLFNQYRR